MGFVSGRQYMNSSYVYLKMAKGHYRIKSCVYFENRVKDLAECENTSKRKLLTLG